MRVEGLRPGQVRAIQTIEERVIAGERYTSIVLPTRYGKTHVMRLATLRLIESERISCALMFSPSAFLRDQAINLDQWNQAASLSGLGLAPKATSLKKMLETLDWVPNGEMFIAATMQLLVRWPEVFAAFAEHRLKRTGRPVMVHVDECHMGTAEDLEWGKALATVVEAGALAVLYTATAMRSDKRPIPGFRMSTVDIEPRKVTKTHREPESELLWVQLYAGMEKQLVLEADHETTFAEAWKEFPSPLCRFSRIPFDVELTTGEDEEGPQQVLLSELSPTEAARQLGKVVRNKRAIQKGVDLFVENLEAMREDEEDAAGIIFCSNDRDDGDGEAAVNQHAHAIKRAIRARSPKLAVLIATSAEEGQQNGKEIIESFQQGVGDVLIVKQMASAGLDCERLKVELDLSPVRTAAAVIQRWTRIGTPYRRIKHAIVIMPNDVNGEAAFNAFVTDAGGETAIMDLELIDEYLAESGQSNQPVYVVDGTDGARFEDSDLNRAEKDELARVMEIVRSLPGVTAIYTHAELARRTEGWNMLPQASAIVEGASNPEVEAELLRADINEIAKEIVSQQIPYRKENRDRWVNALRILYGRLKSEAGITNEIPLEDVRDLEQLRHMKSNLRRQLSTLLAARSLKV